MHIVDRRLNPSSKSLENRQRFLRRNLTVRTTAVKLSSPSQISPRRRYSVPLISLYLKSPRP